jgi:hypothetical protein
MIWFLISAFPKILFETFYMSESKTIITKEGGARYAGTVT